MKNCSILLLVLAVVLASCRKTQKLTEEEVVAIINRFDSGWESKDLKAVDAVLSPAYVYFTQSGGIFSRQGVVETAGSPEYTLETMKRSAVEVTLYENTAVVSTRWHGRGTYRGVAFDEDQRCSITVIKTKNKVEILSEHCTPVKTARIFH